MVNFDPNQSCSFVHATDAQDNQSLPIFSPLIIDTDLQTSSNKYIVTLRLHSQV